MAVLGDVHLLPQTTSRECYRLHLNKYVNSIERRCITKCIRYTLWLISWYWARGDKVMSYACCNQYGWIIFARASSNYQFNTIRLSCDKSTFFHLVKVSIWTVFKGAFWNVIFIELYVFQSGSYLSNTKFRSKRLAHFWTILDQNLAKGNFHDSKR